MTAMPTAPAGGPDQNLRNTLVQDVQSFRNAQKEFQLLYKLVQKYHADSKENTHLGVSMANRMTELGSKYPDSQFAVSLGKLGQFYKTLEDLRGTFLDNLQNIFVNPVGTKVKEEETNCRRHCDSVTLVNGKFDTATAKMESDSREATKKGNPTLIQHANDTYTDNTKFIDTNRKEMVASIQHYRSEQYSDWMKSWCAVMEAQNDWIKAASAELARMQLEWNNFRTFDAGAPPTTWENTEFLDKSISGFRNLKAQEKNKAREEKKAKKQSRKKGSTLSRTEPTISGPGGVIGAPGLGPGIGMPGAPGPESGRRIITPPGSLRGPEKVRALYNFTGSTETELNLKIGDVIVVLDKSDSSWWRGNLSGVIGYFPNNYVEPYIETTQGPRPSVVPVGGQGPFGSPPQTALPSPQASSSPRAMQPAMGSEPSKIEPHEGQPSPPAVEDPVAAGWGEFKTDDGHIYFFNMRTQESRWEPPPGWKG